MCSSQRDFMKRRFQKGNDNPFFVLLYVLLVKE